MRDAKGKHVEQQHYACEPLPSQFLWRLTTFEVGEYLDRGAAAMPRGTLDWIVPPSWMSRGRLETG